MLIGATEEVLRSVPINASINTMAGTEWSG